MTSPNSKISLSISTTEGFYCHHIIVLQIASISKNSNAQARILKLSGLLTYYGISKFTWTNKRTTMCVLPGHIEVGLQFILQWELDLL